MCLILLYVMFRKRNRQTSVISAQKRQKRNKHTKKKKQNEATTTEKRHLMCATRLISTEQQTYIHRSFTHITNREIHLGFGGGEEPNEKPGKIKVIIIFYDCLASRYGKMSFVYRFFSLLKLLLFFLSCWRSLFASASCVFLLPYFYRKCI